MKQKYIVCFVCTGNACRSPFAECVLRTMFEEEGMNNIEVFSRGTLDCGENHRDENIMLYFNTPLKRCKSIKTT
ncbi:uncharacterized protein BN697_01853 [Bacteroides sp. CAG:530]|nr:uncharacterized protein BN697_01853 [Bacteroides sp. CAG:530]